MRKSFSRVMIAGAAAGLLALAGAAGAEEGMGIMVEKDLASKTVTLMDGTELRVSDSTRITRREPGSRDVTTISFGQLSPAVPFGGGLEVTGENQIEWSGKRRSGARVNADRIEVLGALVE